MIRYQTNFLDYLIPMIIFVIIIICIYYFKKNNIINDVKELESKALDLFKFGVTNKEDFMDIIDDIASPIPPTPILGETINLSGFNVQIHGNLLSGFTSREDADKQLDIVKNIVKSNPSKFNNLDLTADNIFLNGNTSGITPFVKKICLGNIEKGDSNMCIDDTLITKFNEETQSIPNFRNANDKLVYYNEDSKSSDHNKLCFNETKSTNEQCITAQHFNMINGNNGVELKYVTKDTDTPDSDKIKPYLVEYGERKGFPNVVKRVFYLPTTNYNELKNELQGTDGTKFAETCYGAGGRQWHIVDPPYGEAAKWGGHFYLSPQPFQSDTYSHIHDHQS